MKRTEMITQRDFAMEVKKILDDNDTPIGATEGDMVKFKTHKIMMLAGIKVDLTNED